MMIASPGLLKTLEVATGTNQVNKELALLVVEQVKHFIYSSPPIFCWSYYILFFLII